MLDKKLQLKNGQTIALIAGPMQLQLAAHQAAIDKADAVLIFAANETELRRRLGDLKAAVRNNKLTWIAYPKAKQLDTDLNRDVVRNIVNTDGLNPVRQIAIDGTWSALRLKLVAK